jgi:lipopolysaccharide transport system permease protein
MIAPQSTSTPMMDATARPLAEIRPRTGALELDIAALWEYRELLYFLVWREVKIRYKQAALGVAWAIIQPVFAVIILTIVFGLFARFPSEGVPYSVFAFAAVLPWTYFAEAVRRSATGLVGDADLIRKIYFPRLLIPLAMVAAPLIDFAMGFLVLLVMMAWHGIWPTWHLLALPMLLLDTLLLALTFGLWLAPLNVRYRDIMHTLPFLIQVWMYATPIVYPLGMIPERWRPLYSINPTVGIIEAFRWSIFGKASVDLTAIAIGLGVTAVALLGGLVYFRKMERCFADFI